jgi:hypothetical protein
MIASRRWFGKSNLLDVAAAAAGLPALAMSLRSGSRGSFHIAKPYLVLLDIPPTSRLSNGRQGQARYWQDRWMPGYTA